MLIKFIINLVEALIVSYSLSRLCHVKKQKLYFVLNTLMTFSIEIISDYFDANYAPLAIAYIICWNILLLFFTRKEYIYNLFMCIFNELLITLSALLPLMFISHYYLLLAAVEAKIYHLLLSVLFIRYQKRYRYFINKYWILVMMNLIACLLILNLQGRIIIEGSYTFKTIMTIFLCIFVVFLSLTFFAFLEESNNEKEKVTKQLEERKYQNITYDMMKRTKEELYRLEHSLTYYMLSIKKYLETQNQDEVYKIIDSHIERVSNVNIVIYTGNDLFDLSLTTHLSQMSSKVNMCIMISKDEFYNHIQFIEFVLSLLDLIESKDVSLLIKEDGFVKLIQISAEYDFIDENQVKEIVNRDYEFDCHYQMITDQNLHLLKIKIIEHFE